MRPDAPPASGAAARDPSSWAWRTALALAAAGAVLAALLMSGALPRPSPLPVPAPAAPLPRRQPPVVATRSSAPPPPDGREGAPLAPGAPGSAPGAALVARPLELAEGRCHTPETDRAVSALASRANNVVVTTLPKVRMHGAQSGGLGLIVNFDGPELTSSPRVSVSRPASQASLCALTAF